MIAIEDVIGLCGLGPEEVAAIAEHEHIPDIAAAAYAAWLLRRKGGPQGIQRMICEDIREAIRRDEAAHARELFMALRHYMTEHPEAARGAL